MVELRGTRPEEQPSPPCPAWGLRGFHQLRVGGKGKGGSEEAAVLLPGVCDGIDEQQVGRGLPVHPDPPTWQCPEGITRIAVWFWCFKTQWPLDAHGEAGRRDLFTHTHLIEENTEIQEGEGTRLRSQSRKYWD